MVLGLLEVAPALFGQPSVSGVLNAASFDAAISPGCWAAVMGNGLANTTDVVGAAPLPFVLDGVMVTVNGIAAELLYVSPKQINLVIPAEIIIPENTVVPLIVTSSGAKSKPYNIRLLPYAPAVFTFDSSGSGRALAFKGRLPADSVSPGDTVTLYATGLGPTADSFELREDVEVYLGDRRAQVTLARRAMGLDGLYRIDATAPVLATDRLYLRAEGWQSNITQIGIQPGTNVSKATGAIDAVYPPAGPSSGMATTFALMLYAGSFSTSFDIAPSAGPFDIAAVGESGGAIITIDPTAACVDGNGVTSQGTYRASISTVTPDGARGDFSGSVYPLWDYLTCDTTWACLSFPLSSIPTARLGGPWVAATQMLPAASVLTSAGANALALGSGCLNDVTASANRSHLTIDGGNNQGLSVFGGFLQLALGPSGGRVSTFTLYVDGVKIASKSVSYMAPYRP
jgi:uncharacterized protein (TIGR03437 family)